MTGMFKIAKDLGFVVKFIPHEIIKDYIACYNVVYDGKEIFPPAATVLGIPKNEIWISDAFRDFAEYILYHEIQEIKHRAQGYDVDEAHLSALKDEEMKFKDDEKWRWLKREINVCTFEELKSTPGIGNILAHRIMENRPYNRMDELLKVKGIGKKRLGHLKSMFWCLSERS